MVEPDPVLETLCMSDVPQILDTNMSTGPIHLIAKAIFDICFFSRFGPM